MKVFINGRFLGQRVTGVQRSAESTVRALDRLLASGDLDRRAWSFELLVPPQTNAELGLEHIPVREVGRARGHVWEQVELAWHSRSGILVSLANAAPLARRRQCVMLHDASVFAVPEAYSRRFCIWYRLLIPGLGRRAALVLTVSAFSRAELVRHAGIPARKMRLVPHGSEHVLAAKQDDSIIARHALNDRPFILAVGSLSPHKNFAGLVHAFDRLERNRFRLVIAGGTDPAIFGTTGLPLSADVTHLGYVSDGALRSLYAHAACFVFPSLYEGFGLPPLEAMACGCPVVASRAASLPEVCGDAAAYCDPHDPDDMARTILKVVTTPGLRESMRARGIAHAGRFNWDCTARALVDAVAELRAQ